LSKAYAIKPLLGFVRDSCPSVVRTEKAREE